MRSDLLLPKLSRARSEIDRLGYLSYRTRFRLFVSETHHLHNALIAFSELLCGHYCFAQTPSYLEPSLKSKIDANFAYCFEWMRHPKIGAEEFDKNFAIIREFYFAMTGGAEERSYIDPEFRKKDQKQYDKELIRLAASYTAISKFMSYMTREHSYLDYEDCLELDDNDIDFESAEAADLLLAWHTGFFDLKAGKSSQKAWRFYLEEIVPKASELENQLGEKARRMKLNRLFYT